MMTGDGAAAAPHLTRERIAAFVRGFSIEALPTETEHRFGDFAAAPPGTRLYLTRVPNAAFGATVEAARRVRAAGYVPVAHLAARSIRDKAGLHEQLAELTDAGVDEILLVAGSQTPQLGAFSDTLQTLATGEFERAGIRRIGVAGHPEGHPHAAERVLDAALDEKNAYSRATGIEMYLITQFFFDEAPVIAWERRIRERGNRLPVYAGVHGLTDAASLLRFAIDCGVGASLAVLSRQTKILKPALLRSPGLLVLELVRAIASDERTLFAGLHFFPLGSSAKTSAWAAAVAAGRFTLRRDGTIDVSN